METLIKLLIFILCILTVCTLIRLWSNQLRAECEAQHGLYFRGHCIVIKPESK